jgi:hypothetical protein
VSDSTRSSTRLYRHLLRTKGENGERFCLKGTVILERCCVRTGFCRQGSWAGERGLTNNGNVLHALLTSHQQQTEIGDGPQGVAGYGGGCATQWWL